MLEMYVSASTLLKLSVVRIPISRSAWLNVAFESSIQSISVNMSFNGPLLMIWPSKALSTLKVILLHSRGVWSHSVQSHYNQGCYDTWSLYIVLFENLLKWFFQVDDRVKQGRLDPHFLLGMIFGRKLDCCYLYNLQKVTLVYPMQRYELAFSNRRFRLMWWGDLFLLCAFWV